MMQTVVLLLIFLVAVVYASVGHGGASGYLAVLSLFALSPFDMRVSALCLNLLVSGTAFVAYRQAGHFDPRLLWPFAIASIPAAYVGGSLKVPSYTYSWLLGMSLLVAAWRLAGLPREGVVETSQRPPHLRVTLPLGAGIGLLSGIVGIGGGIFLSPWLLLARWADAKRTAAVSAGFIWMNSAAALAAHLRHQHLDVLRWAPWVLAAFLGGCLGSYLGARRFNSLLLCRLLAVVLLVAAVKLVSRGM
ncbi:MAG: sulfite exporter TauE/SafE family protein [Elusimicrobia bacterium]|nr:sulfite exporter TauE/SafE family protein [Elusimicrobiota bacterium]